MSPARPRTQTTRSGDERTNLRPPCLPQVEVNKNNNFTRAGNSKGLLTSVIKWKKTKREMKNVVIVGGN